MGCAEFCRGAGHFWRRSAGLLAAEARRSVAVPCIMSALSSLSLPLFDHGNTPLHFRLYVAHSMWCIATAIRRSRRSRRSRSKLAVAFRAGRYSVDCTCTDEEEVARQISAAMCGGVVDGSAVRPGHTAIRPLIRPRAIDRIAFMAESSHRHRDRGRRQTSTNSNCRRVRNVRSRR
jgi:hypothetical protein